MKHRTLFLTILILCIFLFVCFLSTGLVVRTDVVLGKYEETDKSINFSTSLASSFGYIRGCKCEQIEDKMYLTFYQTFCGFKWGSKSDFEVALSPEVTEIYFCSWEKKFVKVFEKDEKGIWQRISKN